MNKNATRNHYGLAFFSAHMILLNECWSLILADYRLYDRRDLETVVAGYGLALDVYGEGAAMRREQLLKHG
jgi:hypothetical protein